VRSVQTWFRCASYFRHIFNRVSMIFFSIMRSVFALGLRSTNVLHFNLTYKSQTHGRCLHSRPPQTHGRCLHSRPPQTHGRRIHLRPVFRVVVSVVTHVRPRLMDSIFTLFLIRPRACSPCATSRLRWPAHLHAVFVNCLRIQRLILRCACILSCYVQLTLRIVVRASMTVVFFILLSNKSS
jgi:hypothetical protein